MATKFPPPRPEPHNQHRSRAVLVPIPQPISSLNSIDTNVFYGNRTNSSSPTTAPSNQASNTIRETVNRNFKMAKSSATGPGPGPDQHPTSRNLKRPGPRRAPIAQQLLRATGPLHVPYTLRIPCKHLSYAPEPVTLSCTCTLVQVTSLNLDYLAFSLSPVSFYFSHARNMNP